MARGKKKSEALCMVETRYREHLEGVLGCVLPENEAKETAGRLLGVFGSLSGVLKRTEKELAEVPGMEGEAARLMALVGALVQESLEEQAAQLYRIYDTPSAVTALRPHFTGRKTEAVGLALLDRQGRVLYNSIVCEGSVSMVPMYIRRLVGLCIEYDATAVLLAHNHPSGNVEPSRNDVVATRQIGLALESIEATLMDHIIFSDGNYFSFSASGMWGDTKDDLREYSRRELESARTLEHKRLSKKGAAN